MIARLLVAIGLIFGVSVLVYAQSVVPGFPPGTFNRGANSGAGAPPAYTGPGDVVSGAKVFWSTYSCYNAAYSGNVMSVWDASTGNTTHTLVTCSGGTVSETINSLATTCAVACEVETLYDQSGALACAGSTACNLTLAFGDRAVLVLSSINSTPCVSSTGGKTFESAANFTLAQPFTINIVSRRTSGTSALYATIRDGTSSVGTIRAGYYPTVDTTAMYNGSGVPSGPTASDSAFHALAYVFADATQSVIYVDGTGTNQTLGATTGFGSSTVALFPLGEPDVVVACEVAIWGSDIGANSATLSTNARTRYGSF